MKTIVAILFTIIFMILTFPFSVYLGIQLARDVNVMDGSLSHMKGK